MVIRGEGVNKFQSGYAKNEKMVCPKKRGGGLVFYPLKS